ncbi:hypothetical protein AGABI1DRAFT_80432 [Agaricus bisporus var. burnettii JB137-S8]|uniref:Lariat debranching enzyme C-terminal domain-containing protein n=1 Tax=Agaricus bisporus var. burnettii (strain JB137-S8 / ATCC MYA-4627 / FGSC 10392) TaxID=597362 RepID=K5WI87_AGABU|nr:uncharacterized protein AGABI1DRAFT_80432 [Agaricus bisporus var. burnettii JB137-S8]EKM74996.1 hypothetical protein AGABI1DRAFT_80432 [Agaricus bisporus var. burnettii JB137-S8]
MKIAVEGCCHGELDAIYDHIRDLENRNKYKVDLLLICGDFQAMRNLADLQCMSVPNKYKKLGGFYKYYTREKTAPLLTIVIGGNHEASNYMWELYHGGWLAPNIYFLGHAGCVRVNGVDIAGASGIFKGHDFRLGNYETLPYTPGSMRSIYHIREFNVRRLSLLSQPTIFLSHDWPQSIEHHGDLKSLLRNKPFFRQDIDKGELGSPPMMGLLRNLKPKWWFSAHLHTRFEANVVHESVPELESSEGRAAKVQNPDEIIIEDTDVDVDPIAAEGSTNLTTSTPPAVSSLPKQNPDEITLDEEEDVVEAPPLPAPAASQSRGSVTRFLALDKCLPRRQFLEVSSTTSDGTYHLPVLEYSPEWLAITRAFHPWFSTTRHQLNFPDEEEARSAVASATQWVVENLQSEKLLVDDVQQFVRSAPGPVAPASPNQRVNERDPQPPAYLNPQTEAFCKMIGIENKINPGGLCGGGDSQ